MPQQQPAHLRCIAEAVQQAGQVALQHIVAAARRRLRQQALLQQAPSLQGLPQPAPCSAEEAGRVFTRLQLHHAHVLAVIAGALHCGSASEK